MNRTQQVQCYFFQQENECHFVGRQSGNRSYLRMKMPEKIEPAMFAPCGMNCLVCYKHCYHRKPCAGCLKSDQGKPEHCRKCKIKDCVAKRQITYCFECPEYPCKQIKRLEKSYNIRYHASLMGNSQMVKEQGMAGFLAQQKEKYT